MSTTSYVKAVRTANPKGLPCECEPKGGLPGWMYDVLADRKLRAGYKLRVKGQSNVCPKCHLTRSVNGTCGC